MKITVNTELVSASATNLKARSSELEVLNERLANIINEIESSWEGNASKRYIKKMRKYEKQADKMKRLIDSFVDYLELIVKTFDAFDLNHARTINNSW